ncbi:hypothetical protein TCON_0186 [Astathelohania contejeani]|uniref:Uncharacterized protein n=1 Tax=Astathelohania contejeani TaxID=164912 RepID=A0ABQ7I2Q1_9MICR|nr:hypothetical protein TCON_0186 [Thelohania contejeani]
MLNLLKCKWFISAPMKKKIKEESETEEELQDETVNEETKRVAEYLSFQRKLMAERVEKSFKLFLENEMKMFEMYQPFRDCEKIPEIDYEEDVDDNPMDDVNLITNAE